MEFARAGSTLTRPSCGVKTRMIYIREGTVTRLTDTWELSYHRRSPVTRSRAFYVGHGSSRSRSERSQRGMALGPIIMNWYGFYRRDWATQHFFCGTAFLIQFRLITQRPKNDSRRRLDSDSLWIVSEQAYQPALVLRGKVWRCMRRRSAG